MRKTKELLEAIHFLKEATKVIRSQANKGVLSPEYRDTYSLATHIENFISKIEK